MDQNTGHLFRVVACGCPDKPLGRRLPFVWALPELAAGTAVLVARLLVSATRKFQPCLFGYHGTNLELAHGGLGTQQLLQFFEIPFCLKTSLDAEFVRNLCLFLVE